MDATLERKVAELAREIAGDAKTIGEVNGALRLMMKSAVECMLDTEMDAHLGRRPTCVEEMESDRLPGQTTTEDATGKKRTGNRRNGHSSKTVQAILWREIRTWSRGNALREGCAARWSFLQ